MRGAGHSTNEALRVAFAGYPVLITTFRAVLTGLSFGPVCGIGEDGRGGKNGTALTGGLLFYYHLHIGHERISRFYREASA